MRYTLVSILFCGVLALPGTVRAETFSESYDAGYTNGTNLAAYSPDWYGDGLTNSPTIQSGQGVAASVGLSPAKNCFSWPAHAFTWTDPTLTGVIVGMDFQAAASGDAFSDDRIGWTTSPSTSDTGYIFCVQLGKNSTTLLPNIQGYYKSSPTGSTRTDEIVSSTTPATAGAWYRLRAQFTKLTNTSAQIDVSLQALNADGSLGAVIVTGTVADTSVISGTWTHTPPAALFTALTMCPSFKNYDQKAAARADNAYLQILRTLPDCAAIVSPDPDQLAVAEIGQPANPSTIDYTFNNVGLQAITYSVVELDAAQQPADVPWLSLNKSGGTVASQTGDVVTASLSTTGLAGGRYTAYLKFTDDCDPANEYLRRIDLDVYACHWMVDSCSQERAYMLDYPAALPDDVVYRITNTGSSPMNYTVTKSGDAAQCFEWLTLTNATGSLNAGEHVDVIASVDPQGLVGHGTDETYVCRLNFSDGCSPQVVTRDVSLRYLGVGDTQVFVYDGSTLPTNNDSAGPGLRFDLSTDSQFNGAVEPDPDADNQLVWRMIDVDGTMMTWYRATYMDDTGQWVRVRERGAVGSTILARVKLRSWGPIGGTRRAILRIAEQYASSADYHWGGLDGFVAEMKRGVSVDSGMGTDEFVTLRLTSVGSEENPAWDCGRTVRLYLNENSIPVLEILNAVPKGTGTSGDRGFWFGDSNTSGQLDIAFDWVSGTNAGAFAPGEEVAVLGRSLVPTFDPALRCPVPFADMDRDGDVDQSDFAFFQACFTGGGTAYGDWQACHCLDRDDDDDIDSDDHWAFEACATGPGLPFDRDNPPQNCVPW